MIKNNQIMTPTSPIRPNTIKDPERICSAGFWDPLADHPNLMRPVTEAEKRAFIFRDFQTSPDPKTLNDLGSCSVL